MSIKAKRLQPAKTAAINTTKDTLKVCSDYIFVNYRGLTVEQITSLRDKLREKNCALKIFKNNFARVAFEDLKINEVASYLSGPTAIGLVKEDPNEVAKILFDFSKDVPALEVKGAWVEKELYDAKAVEAFSKLPGKKQLIAMIAATINAPVQKVAATLLAYVEKKQSEGSAVEPKAEN